MTAEIGNAEGQQVSLPGAYIPIAAETGMPVRPKKKSVPLFLPLSVIVIGIVAAASAATIVAKGKKAQSAPEFQDLGAGISNATGLKGNLKVRWQGTGQYQIKFEPIHPLQSAGFSYVAANPRSQMSINVRILDATGFALCNQEIWFSAGRGSEADDRDVFQNSKGESGKVIGFSAQGLLPCTEDQFRQASYWDFNTNFPTVDEQDALMRQSTAAKARKEAAQRDAKRASGSLFFTEGYDGVAGYDRARNVLETRLGRDFVVSRASDRAAASTWAMNNALFHYKCDQRSSCSLTHAGGSTIYVTAMQ